jgi:hypothetical protein
MPGARAMLEVCDADIGDVAYFQGSVPSMRLTRELVEFERQKDLQLLAAARSSAFRARFAAW